MTDYTFPDQLLADRDAGRKVYLCEPPPAPQNGGCPNCGGLGYMYGFYVSAGPFQRVQAREPSTYVQGEGWYVGQRLGFPCPVCGGDKLFDFLARNSGLQESDLALHLDNYLERPGNQEARAIAGSLLSMTPLPAGFVTFYGKYGVGKTRLIMTLVNGFRRAGVFASYVRLADLLAEVRSGFGDDHPVAAAEGILARFKNVRCLCIDEVDPDKVNLTPWARETVFRLLDGRFADQKIGLTVLACNTPPEQLSGDWGYISSRMTGGIVCELTGGDIRPGLGMQARQSLIKGGNGNGNS